MYAHGCVAKKTVYSLLFFWMMPLSSIATEAESDSVVPECRIEADYLEQVSLQGSSPDHVESFSCFRTIDEVTPEQSLIVDIRTPDAYRQARIPGSINLSSNKLLNTGALQSRDLLVVDQGFSRSRMAEFCAKAEVNGFERLTVLVGGTAAWSAAGLEMQGAPDAIARLYDIEPSEFFAEVSRQRVTVLVDESQTESLQQLIGSEVKVLGLPDSGDAIEQQLVSLFSSGQYDEIFPMVYVGSDPAVTGFARKHRSLFVLDQTPDELRAKRHQLLASATQRKGIPERYRCGG